MANARIENTAKNEWIFEIGHVDKDGEPVRDAQGHQRITTVKLGSMHDANAKDPTVAKPIQEVDQATLKALRSNPGFIDLVEKSVIRISAA